MRTVRDFKNHFLQTLGCTPTRQGLTEAQSELWERLNKLGWKKKTVAVEDTDDVDATAPLTDEEWDALEKELQRVQ